MVITDLELGGVPLHVYRLAVRLKRHCQLRVVSLSPPGPVTGMLTAAGIETDACDARSPYEVTALVKLGRLVRSYRPHLLHAFLFHANMAARLVGPVCALPPRRIICEIQTVEVERRWHLSLDNLTCRLCACQVVNSRSVFTHLVTAAHLPPERLVLIEGGIEVARFEAPPPLDRASVPIPHDAPFLLWVGRLDPIKGLDELIEGFAAIAQDTRSHLLLAGEGDYRPHVTAQISRHRLCQRVHLLGSRDDVPSLLAAADVFVFPSRTEGMPNALLEAMASGCGIVATDVPGCRDLITHRQTGLLVPARSPKAIAAGARDLLNDRPLALSLGRRARAAVQAKHTVEAACDRYRRLYQRLQWPQQ